jgi:hypothetical protein
LSPAGARDGDAIASLTEAVAVARRQGAKRFELRAARDLATLLFRVGRSADADDVLRHACPDVRWPEGMLTPADAELALS